MIDNNLIQTYRDLLSDVEKVYVFPNILKMEANKYLRLFYKDLLSKKPDSNIQLETYSFFPPKIILRRIRGEKSLLHHHWYEIDDFYSLLKIIWKSLWMTIYKLMGGRIIWTVHNKYPHAQKFSLLNRVIRKQFAKMVDRLHVHCSEAIKIMAPILGASQEKFVVIKHPFYPATVLDRSQSIQRLNETYPHVSILPENIIFMMFGYISGYKGILEVVEIFKLLNPNNRLIIAGPVRKSDQQYLENIQRLINGQKQIILIDAFIPEPDVSIFFGAADYVIFNYKDILNSGAVYLSLSYHKKIIMPNQGCLKELEGENIYKFEDLDGLKAILQRF